MKWLFCCLWMCSELPINACLIHQAVSTGYHVHRTRGCTCTYTYIYMMHMYFANILMHRRLNSFLPVASNLVFSKQVAVTIHKIMTGCECAVFSQWHEALSWLLYSGVINILTVSLARYNYFIMSTFYAAFENITYLLLVILITWLFVCFHSIANRYLSKLYIITGTARVFIFYALVHMISDGWRDVCARDVMSLWYKVWAVFVLLCCSTGSDQLWPAVSSHRHVEHWRDHVHSVSTDLVHHRVQ